AEALQKGQSISIKPPATPAPAPKTESKPASPKPASPQPVPPIESHQVSKPVENHSESIQNVTEMREEARREEKKPKTPKPLKVLHGYVYKETSQRGGQKWYLGEKEEIVKKKLAEKEAERQKKRELAALEENSDSPASSEQNTNEG